MQNKSWRRDKRSVIIEAAAHVFATRGYTGTLIADIAAKAGVGKGTIYEYFNSKEDLFFAVFEWFVRATEADAKVSVQALGGSASERLEVLAANDGHVFTRHGILVRLRFSADARTFQTGFQGGIQRLSQDCFESDPGWNTAG
jgi:AcrR family transcriptional regulator